MPKKKKNPSLSFFFHSLQGQTCCLWTDFNPALIHLKSETKSPFTSLTAGRFYVFLLLLPSQKKVFIQLCHGSLECWKCEGCQNVLITMTYSTWRQECIMLTYWCKGSSNSPFYLKIPNQINKTTTTATSENIPVPKEETFCFLQSYLTCFKTFLFIVLYFSIH